MRKLTAMALMTLRSACSAMLLALAAETALAAPDALPDSRASLSGTDRQIRFFERKVSQQPKVVTLRNRLARVYIQKARENGDASYLARAETVLTNSLEQEPADAETLGLYAWVLLFKHDFRGAALWAEKAEGRRPKDSWSYGVLSDAALEMGDYAKALSYAQTMMDLRPDQGSYSRAAHLRSIYGDPAGAIGLWRMAIRAGTPQGEATAWCRVELGDEYFNQGKLREAEEQFIASLAAFPDYHRGLAGLAKVREAQERRTDAAQLYQRAAGVLPSPQYIAALGDVYRLMGESDKAERQYRLVEQIAGLDRINQVRYNRDLALFYADHGRSLDAALQLARQELEVRQDIHTYDILAWALYRNRRYAEAQDAIQKALKLGTRDARMFFHAGMIADALGQRREAQTALDRALAINPYLPPLYRKTARETLEHLR